MNMITIMTFVNFILIAVFGGMVIYKQYKDQKKARNINELLDKIINKLDILIKESH